MCTSVQITREASLPDPVRLERCRKAPELGPRLLFFGGGTALRATSGRLVGYTHNSIHLRLFEQHMPRDFDLRGANIGNPILTGGYLNQDRHIDPVVFLFSRLVEVRGVVRPVASGDLICYPIGSFYSSLVASLLAGVLASMG